MFDLLNQGGALFMYPILLFLIAVIGLIGKAFLEKGDNKKTLDLIASISLFTVIWGVLGQVIGLLEAFDALAVFKGEVSTALLAGGLRVSFLTTAFGIIVF
jgi:hypothetical protein